MIKIGEETGQLGNILKTLSNFYRREVINAVDTIVGLIGADYDCNFGSWCRYSSFLGSYTNLQYFFGDVIPCFLV